MVYKIEKLLDSSHGIIAFNTYWQGIRDEFLQIENLPRAWTQTDPSRFYVSQSILFTQESNRV